MRKRILSIQGGGVNGIYAARLLQRVEAELVASGRPSVRAGDYFDLVTGTSTGGLIALATAAGIPAENVVELYLHKSSKIFPWHRRSRVSKAFRAIVGQPFYKNDRLIRELKNIFGDKLLGDVKTRVLIPAYRVSGRGQVRIYKTAHHPAFENDFQLKIRDIAAATSSAPIYFPSYTMSNGDRVIDGGVWANNPIDLAAIEAIEYLNWNRHEIDILSIRGVQDGGVKSRWTRLARTPSNLIDSQTQGSSAKAKTLVGDINSNTNGSGRIMDFAESVPADYFNLDSAKEMRELVGVADDVFMRKRDQVMHRFFEQVSPEFRPFHLLQPPSTSDKSEPRQA